MIVETEFRYLELVVRHCKKVYNASCIDEAFAKARLMKWVDLRGNITSAGKDLALLIQYEPSIYRKAYDISHDGLHEVVTPDLKQPHIHNIY